MNKRFFITRVVTGSYCVVYRSPDLYIDAQKMAGNRTKIEVVYKGQARTSIVVINERAPETIIDLMRGL